MLLIDSAILNVTEWFCRKFQLLTGKTNAWIAFQLTNLSIVVYFLWTGLFVWNSRGALQIILLVFCATLLYLLMQTVFKVPVEIYEANAYQRVAKGLRNPRRVRDAMLRIPFLTLSVMLFYPILLVYRTFHTPLALLGHSLIVLTTVLLYVLACDPLPPCAGRLRAWLGAPRPVPAESRRYA